MEVRHDRASEGSRPGQAPGGDPDRGRRRQIKDVIYSSQTGELAGFTLNGRGLFSGPLRKTLPWENVHGLGPAAVMIRDESALADRKALQGETEGAGGAVLGSDVITQSGRKLGVVTDLILPSVTR